MARQEPLGGAECPPGLPRVGVTVSLGSTRKERTHAEKTAEWRETTQGRQPTAPQAAVTLRPKGEGEGTTARAWEEEIPERELPMET